MFAFKVEPWWLPEASALRQDQSLTDLMLSHCSFPSLWLMYCILWWTVYSTGSLSIFYLFFCFIYLFFYFFICVVATTVHFWPDTLWVDVLLMLQRVALFEMKICEVFRILFHLYTSGKSIFWGKCASHFLLIPFCAVNKQTLTKPKRQLKTK